MAGQRKRPGQKPRSNTKRKKHAYSILQEDSSYCYICARKYGDDTPKRTEEHHIFFGAKQRDKSEAEGLKVRLCIPHHRTGPEAVHKNVEMSRMLQTEAQKAWESSHSHEEWMRLMGRNYLDAEEDLTPTERIFEEFKANYPNLSSHMVRMKPVDGKKEQIAIQLNNGRIVIYGGGRNLTVWRENDGQT